MFTQNSKEEPRTLHSSYGETDHNVASEPVYNIKTIPPPRESQPGKSNIAGREPEGKQPYSQTSKQCSTF